MSAPSRPRGEALPRFDTPIVPRNSISGRALVAVVAIMTFLASLTTGAVLHIYDAAAAWRSEVAREMTIQVRPVRDRSIDTDVERAANVARNAAGISAVRILSKEESSRLLEPWLGGALTLEELPVPRMIVLQLASGASPDLSALRRDLAAEVPAAALDDHRGWMERMRAMSTAVVGAGLALLALMLAATMLSVAFATRGAMATNRTVIEVLHFVGARNSFIAGLFQRHFLLMGLEGGVIGGGAAMLIFLVAGLAGGWMRGTSTGDQFEGLFGGGTTGFLAYGAIGLQIVLIAVVTALTSRQTVNRTLETID
ncbi:MAG: ABC transporter permease [Pseudolabrys sp.]|nr:ABC transporter permease [Pseudolabrys sp.]